MEIKDVKKARQRLESEVVELLNHKLLAFQDEFGVTVTGLKVRTMELQRVGSDDSVFVSEVNVEIRV